MLSASILLLIAFCSFFISYYITKFSVKITYRLIKKKAPTFDKKILRAAFSPVRAGFIIGFVWLGTRFVILPDPWVNFVKPTGTILSVFIFTWLVFSVVDLFCEWLSDYLRETRRDGMIGAIPLARRTLKTTVVTLAILAFLQNIGIQVTALLAGLGVGGIALALAAQKTIGDLIGGVMLVLDTPVRVGDDCKFGSFRGTIEEIGVRSTRIRTLERSVVTVPNADFSQMQLENMTLRDRVRFHTTFKIRRDATPDQIRFLLVELRSLLYAHPKVDQDPALVRLSNITDASFEIEIRAYVLTNEYNEFSGVREDLFLRFLDKLKEAGTGLAVPVQENVLAPKVSAEHLNWAKEKVESWRESKELPLPEFSQHQKEALDDTLDFPPKGSVMSY